MKVSPKKLTIAFIGLVPLIILLLPVSNFLMPRKEIAQVEGSQTFKSVSKVLQNKCADCHTPGMTTKPLYYNFPIAKQTIDHDISEAQKYMVISQKQLAGKSPFTRVDLARIHSTVVGNEMPPASYQIFHWNTYITKADRQLLLKWINDLNREEKRNALSSN